MKLYRDPDALEEGAQDELQVALEPALAQVLCNQWQLPPCRLLQQ